MFGVSTQTEVGRRLIHEMLPKEDIVLEGRIDIPKLKAAIKEAEKDPEAGCYHLTLEAAPKGTSFYSNDVPRTTILYALRSHLRGKLHMTKKRYIVGIFVDPPPPSGHAILPVTMADQEKLVSLVWEEFLLEAEEEATEAA